MREIFESYKNELDRIRLTDEGKRALAESLSRRETAKRPMRPIRLKAGAGRIAAAAAVICLLITGAVAAAAGSPTLRDAVFGDSAGYSQSSGFIGRSVEKEGWTVTITDCVGDDRNLYLGIEVEAPEGVVLDADGGYRFLSYSDNLLRSAGSSGMLALPDEDPTDNKIQFMQKYHSVSLDFFTYTGINTKGRLVLKKLVHDFRITKDGKHTYEVDCGATWDFGYLDITYPDSTIRLTPNVPVTTLEVEAVITTLEVSPLSILVKIEGDSLQNHHDWVPKNAPDGWYGCVEYQEVFLYTEDGGIIPANFKDGASAGGGCSEGRPEDKMDAIIVLDRTFDELIDVDSLTAVSVCGAVIPLR